MITHYRQLKDKTYICGKSAHDPNCIGSISRYATTCKACLKELENVPEWSGRVMPKSDAIQNKWKNSPKLRAKLELAAKRRKEAVAMKFEGFSIKEIAEKLGIKEGTVRQYLK